MLSRHYDWTKFKQFVAQRNCFIQFFEEDQYYILWAGDGPIEVTCVIAKEDPASADQIDFESNFKNSANKKLEIPRDSDGSPLNRTKITTTGWHYQLHGIEFSTSTLAVTSKKEDGTDFGFTTAKCYDANGTLLTTQEDCDQYAVKTILDWEPQHDLEIIGGMLKQISAPVEDVRIWVTGVPDIPAQYGGSKPFAVNVNLKFMGVEEGVKVDGRAPKYLTYSPTLHTNKMRLIFKHPAGFKHPMLMIFELFKA